MTQAQDAIAEARPQPAQASPLKLSYHLIIGAAAGLIAPFTAFAWPFALLTGMVIGRAGVDRDHGIRHPFGVRAGRILAVTGGILAMLWFGAILGGLIGFLVVALAAFSERVAGDASPTDRGIARIVLALATIAGFVALLALGLNVNIRIGS